jgi:hypothetical protein
MPDMTRTPEPEHMQPAVMESTAKKASLLAIPSPATLWHLVLGGAAGLGVWEIFASSLTHWAAGFPLRPPELVKSLFEHQLRLTISDPAAALLHGLTGILLYPIGYLILSRLFPKLGTSAAGWIWGVITYFIALGFFAPLAGQPFLLHNFPVLSLMSLTGHAIYGYLAAIVFEALERQAAGR